jgi:C-terminal processing protease CtpA/Prc
MLRRSIVLLLTLSSWCAAQSYDRLAEAAKLWAFVKYCHPGVTASSVDWDAALAKATPKILAAKDDAEFSVAVGEMLAALKDPMTHVIADSEMRGQAKLLPSAATEEGITVVRFGPGTYQAAMQAGAGLARQLAGKGTVVFDLRGVAQAPNVLPKSLPVAKEAVGPSRMMRVHSGYANDAGTGSGGYQSYWETHDAERIQTASSGPIRAIFLVDAVTKIPEIALALQQSGDGAILAEEAMDDRQVNLTRMLPLQGTLYVAVRTSVLAYRDGTTGVIANAVLHQTGDAALKAAIEMAKSGNFPPAPQRVRLDLPQARFVEKPYADQPYPGVEYRMLAAARVWGVFQYFHPYRHLYGEDWDAVLKEFLPKMARAENAREYHLAVAEMVSHVHDSHCGVSSSELLRFYGVAGAAVDIRWFEDQPVVARVLDPAIELRPGDVLTKIDGEPYRKRADNLAKYIAASTPQALMNAVMGALLRGDNGTSVRVTFRRGSEPEREVTLSRTTGVRFNPYRTGDVFRLLSPKIGYVDLEKLTNAQVDEMFEKFKDTDAIVMDMRGYPQGTAWSVAPRLTEKQQVVAAHFERSFVRPDTSSDLVMGLNFDQRIPATFKPRFKGKTVMLIDERAISQSEHSGLFYRAANGTKFIGSPTQGANGDVTYFHAPGNIRINFSGHNVTWPDGKQLQRVGLTPDIEVRPTIEGIRAGRDEVLDRAVRYLETGK